MKHMYKPTGFDPGSMVADTLRARGTMPAGDAATEDAIYDRWAAAKAAGQTMFAANLEQTHADVIARVDARRNPPAAPEAPLEPRTHLDELERLRAAGQGRLAAQYEESFAGVIAVQRVARQQEIAARAEAKAQAAAVAPPAPAPQPQPRTHLDMLEQLRAAGQVRAAASFEAAHAPLIAHERAQRAAELGGAAAPPSSAVDAIAQFDAITSGKETLK